MENNFFQYRKLPKSSVSASTFEKRGNDYEADYLLPISYNYVKSTYHKAQQWSTFMTLNPCMNRSWWDADQSFTGCFGQYDWQPESFKTQIKQNFYLLTCCNTVCAKYRIMRCYPLVLLTMAKANPTLLHNSGVTSFPAPSSKVSGTHHKRQRTMAELKCVLAEVTRVCVCVCVCVCVFKVNSCPTRCQVRKRIVSLHARCNSQPNRCN